ncbi:MAG TPA: hypothetical protein DCL83_08970 [Arthrobacter bacterium]|nr:hypothetical protein [Arthrobacter sp.]
MTIRTHENSAARQKAYRDRVRGQRDSPPPQPKRAPPRTARPARILALARMASDLAAEYGAWLTAMPENLANGALAEELETAISQLDEAAAILEAIEPPRIRR